jgi:hypothetical protein
MREDPARHVTVLQAEVPTTPVPYWLTLRRREEVEAFYAVPFVREVIAGKCLGFKVTCDCARQRGAAEKRRNIQKRPIDVFSAGRVLQLVTNHHFYAFYPALERADGTIGRWVADLDVQPGLRRILGDQRTWELRCDLSDLIARRAANVGLPPPARHFSGSRGIHIYWDLPDDPLPVEGGLVGSSDLVAAVRSVDARAGKTRSNPGAITAPAAALRKVLQALVYGATAGSAALLTESERLRLVLEGGSVLALSKNDPRYYNKVVCDVQPTVFRVFSPHLKSGMIAINLLTPAHKIRPELRNYDTLCLEAKIERVTSLARVDPGRYEEKPGRITEDQLDAAIGALVGDIAAVTKLGDLITATPPADVAYFREYYTKLMSPGRAVRRQPRIPAALWALISTTAREEEQEWPDDDDPIWLQETDPQDDVFPWEEDAAEEARGRGGAPAAPAAETQSAGGKAEEAEEADDIEEAEPEGETPLCH